MSPDRYLYTIDIIYSRIPDTQRMIVMRVKNKQISQWIIKINSNGETEKNKQHDIRRKKNTINEK